jgi:hypothetical protein
MRIFPHVRETEFRGAGNEVHLGAKGKDRQRARARKLSRSSCVGQSLSYLTDANFVKSFAFISGKTGFLFVTNLKDVYTTMTLYRS